MLIQNSEFSYLKMEEAATQKDNATIVEIILVLAVLKYPRTVWTCLQHGLGLIQELPVTQISMGLHRILGEKKKLPVPR